MSFSHNEKMSKVQSKYTISRKIVKGAAKCRKHTSEIHWETKGIMFCKSSLFFLRQYACPCNFWLTGPLKSLDSLVRLLNAIYLEHVPTSLTKYHQEYPLFQLDSKKL